MNGLTEQLKQLENAELVRSLPDDDRAFLFKHALTHESAYESLLLKERRAIHRHVAEAYEALYPDRLDENAALLAQHYAAAGDDTRTFSYAVRAGDAAGSVFAYPEADGHYAVALDALARLPDTTDYRQARADTLVKRVSVSLRTVGPADSLRRLADAETLARPLAERAGATREDRLRLARVQYWQGHALIHQNNARAALELMEQVRRVARAENDAPLLAFPASLVGRTLVTLGQFIKGEAILSDALLALEQVHDEHEWILAAGFHSLALTMLGDLAHGLAEAEQVLTHAMEANTLTGIALAHGMMGIAYLFGNALPEGIEHARTMIDLAARSGDRLYAYLAYGFIAWAEVRSGDCGSAERDFAQTERIAQELGGPLLFADWFAAARVEYALVCDQVEQALVLSQQVIEREERSTNAFATGIAERVQGEALARAEPPRWDEAERHFQASLAKFDICGARLEAARTRIAWGRILERRGNAAAAREQSELAVAAFRAAGLDGQVNSQT